MRNSYKQTPGSENTTNQYSNTPFEYQNQQANLTKQPQQPQPQSQSQQYQQQQKYQNSGQGYQSVSVVNNRESNFNFDDFKIQLKSHDRIIILKKILEIYTICKETQIHKTAENLMLDLSKEHFIEIHKSSVQQTINIIDKVGEIINKADYSNEFQELRFDLPYIHKQYQNLVEICVEHECVNTGDQSYKCKDKKHNRVQLKKINELLKQFKTIELNQQTKVEIYYNDEVFKYLKTVEEIDFSDDSIRTKCGNFPYTIKSLVQTQKQNEDLESEIKRSFEKIMNTMKSTQPLQTLIKPEIQKQPQIVTTCSHQTQEEVSICLEQDCKFSTTTLCKECKYQHENHRTISIKELTEFQSNKDNNIERYMETKKIFQENQYFDQLIQIFCIIDAENLNLAENQCLERLGTKLRELQIYPLPQNKNSIFQSSSELLSKMKVNQNEFKQMEELSNLKCDQHMENQVTHICLDQTCQCHFICIECEQYHPAHHREPISEALKTILSQNQDFSQIIKRESENFKKIKNQVFYFGKDLKVLNFLRQFCKPSEKPKDWKQFALKYREYNSSKNKIVESTKYKSLFHSQYAFQETFIKLLDRLNEQELYKVNIKVNEQLQIDQFKCDICQQNATHIQATGKIVCEEHQEQEQRYSQISEYLKKVMEKESKFDLQTSNWEKLLQKFFNLQIEFMGNMYEALFQTIPRNFNRQQMNQEQGSMNNKLNLYMQQICLKQNNLRFMDYFVNELERFHESSFKKCDHKYQLIYDRNLFYNFNLKNTECAKVIVKNNSQKNSFKLIGLYIGNIQTKDGGTIAISLIKDRDSKTKNIKSSQLKAINNSLTYIELNQNEQVLIEMNKSIEIVITIDQASQVKFHRKHIEQDILLINTIQDIQISFPEGLHKNNLTIQGNEAYGLIQELVLEPIQ